ncbi:TetR/AcrR family transcriptional regulator [Verticiella sediminum]|uniref:TetR/AcrR family transcriptional regulator n=1 Tax=Verticiella sediminum TaxID=1247510 RepID=A0A556AC02_9BURK|nr:TetR/AcrR family transcriptional regulator [Verticiella sediminum]TSH90397.1 TetR/AcrR family transcriptional regulator [Verticiella sediminum]
MGRRRSIDREAVLDAAEAIVIESGAAGLTIDAVARAMGITKGGVQYAFGSKDALVDAMLERWDRTYEAQLRELAGAAPTPVDAMRAHIRIMRELPDAGHVKAASLMAALIREPERLAGTRAWYAERMRGLDAASDEGRRARLAFLAAEGAFLLRYFGFMDMSRDEWDSAFADIDRLAGA